MTESLRPGPPRGRRGFPLDRRGMFGKLVLTLVLVLAGFWVVFNFVLTVPAAELAKESNRARYDNNTAYVLGVVERLGYFPEANMPAFELRTRVGRMWICSTKDYPTVGSRVFMETTVYCTPEKFWMRFSEDLKHRPELLNSYKRQKTVRCELGDQSARMQINRQKKFMNVEYPIGYEMVRFRMPF